MTFALYSGGDLGPVSIVILATVSGADGYRLYESSDGSNYTLVPDKTPLEQRHGLSSESFCF